MKRYSISTHPEMVPVINEIDAEGIIIRTLTYRSAAWMKVWRHGRPCPPVQVRAGEPNGHVGPHG